MYQLRLRQRKGSIRIDQQMAVGRGDVRQAGGDMETILGLHHAEGASAVEDLRHQAGMAGIQVLDHHDPGGEVGRQRLQHRGQRAKPS